MAQLILPLKYVQSSLNCLKTGLYYKWKLQIRSCNHFLSKTTKHKIFNSAHEIDHFSQNMAANKFRSVSLVTRPKHPVLETRLTEPPKTWGSTITMYSLLQNRILQYMRLFWGITIPANISKASGLSQPSDCP